MRAGGIVAKEYWSFESSIVCIYIYIYTFFCILCLYIVVYINIHNIYIFICSLYIIYIYIYIAYVIYHYYLDNRPLELRCVIYISSFKFPLQVGLSP